ncbi:MAG: hypothetical protein L0H96_24630, partial [Humibacillus sp.]|nr:hypothetical protein [Humibacillus sp.]
PDPLTGRAPVGAGSVIAPTPQPQPAPPQSVDQSVASEGDSTAVFRTVTGLGSIAAAGVLALLGLRRQRQTRTRRPGQRINLPTGQAAITEAHIRATADPLTVHDVDLALRTMAHNAVTAGMPIPGLRAARITTTAIELYLTDHTSRLPAPFAAEEDLGVWTLTRATAAGQLLDETTAALTPAPYPTLVTIGHDEDDAHLLLNLEELRTLAITGAAEHTRPVLAAIALELIASQWADAATITLVGVLPELADALGAGNVTYVEDLTQILASLEHTAHTNADEMRAAGVGTPQQARAGGMDADTWTPHLIITAEPPTADQRELVRDILHTSPRTSIAAVTQGAPLGEWQLHVTAPDQAELAPQQIPLTPQRLDQATLNQILDGFRAADEPHHDGPDWAGTIADETPIEQVPDALPDHLEDTTAADANRQGDLEQKRAIALDPARRGPDTDELEAIIDPEHDLTHLIDTIPTAVTTLPATGPVLRLLGPVRIDNPGGQEPQAPARSLKILAHMALAPGGHHPELDQAVWPTISVGTKLRAPAITMARKWIGTAPDGHDYLARHTANGGYRLAEDLPVDWRLFQQLIGPDISQASTQNLADALHLVYGIPLTNAQLGDDASIGYVSHENELISAIADVAHELATRYIQTGKPRAALWAAGKGLDTARGEEALWRDTLRAAHQMRDPDTVTQIIRAYTTYTAGLGCDLDPDTEHLINQINAERPNRHHAHA